MRKDPKSKHLIFYDESCPLCNRAIAFILKRDHRKRFLFAPLQGKTASQLSVNLSSLDTLILLEKEGKILIEGKGALRICWHLGGIYKLLGVLSFLPSALFDAGYRFIAKRRYRLFSTWKKIDEKEKEGRFLP